MRVRVRVRVRAQVWDLAQLARVAEVLARTHAHVLPDVHVAHEVVELVHLYRVRVRGSGLGFGLGLGLGLG